MSAATILASATDAEQRLLALMLAHVRNVVATGEQLAFYIDPYSNGSGLSICCAYNGAGQSERIEGKFRRARKPRRAR